MKVGFCLEALADVLQPGATPGILNTDQGVQFTSAAFMDAVQACGARVSMGGKGRWVDNVMVERLWRSLKCEAMHLHDLADGREAHRNQIKGRLPHPMERQTRTSRRPPAPNANPRCGAWD